MNRRVKLAAYLAHVRRADGSWPVDWAFARPALLEARHVLHHYLTDARLPHELTIKAYVASEDLRASGPASSQWDQLQAQVIRVLPVVHWVLRTLVEFKRAE
jgi:hypothetical protein